MKKSFVAVVVLILSACGSSGLDGTYSDSMDIVSYTFKSGGKVVMSGLGTQIESNYEVADGNVRIETPRGTQLMPILDDGNALGGPMGMKLTRREE